jgi:RNA polymerase sigma-B factor
MSVSLIPAGTTAADLLPAAGPGPDGAVPRGAATEPGHTGAPQRRERDGYAHLAPLFVERAALPADHPRRDGLRAELIDALLPLARNIARRYAHRGDSLEDLEQVASVGLVLAVDRFDPGRGTDILSFAVPTISGEVLRYFRDRACTIRTPRRLRTLQSMVHDATATLTQRHGRAPRPSEIAVHLDVDAELVLEALAAQDVAHTASLDEPAAEGDGNRMRFGTALAQVDEEFDLVEQRAALAPLLAALPERERRILLLRFFGGLTQTEIGARIGVSQMHVSRLLNRTLEGLRRQLAAD